MRMDNETFRLKVENLLGSVRTDNGDGYDPEVVRELEQLATTPRRTRYFLRAVSSQADPELEERFYRMVMGRVRSEQEVSDLERHIRHMFYTDREHAKAILAKLAQRDVLPALFRVIAFTEEGWLAGELIRIVLQAPEDELYEPIVEALDSKDYLLQCLAIYLVGKSARPRLLHALARFYRRPIGEKIDRLEKKSLDALLEGAKEAPDGLIVKWLKDKSSRVRDLALTLAQERRLELGIGEIASLVLIDPITRSKAASVLLSFEEAGVLELDPKDERTDSIAQLIQGAKQEALHTTLGSLMRDESAAVREVSVKLTRFLKDPKAVANSLRRVATEERASAVQIAALKALADIEPDRLVNVLVEVFTDTSLAGVGGRDVVDTARELMHERLSREEIEQVEAGIKAKEEQRDAALDRFSGDVEWWRHDL